MLREQLPTDILCVASIRAHVHRLIHMLVSSISFTQKKRSCNGPPTDLNKTYDNPAMEMPVHAGLAAVGRLPRARSTRREPKRTPAKDPKWMPGKCPQGIRNPGGMEPVFDANAYPIVEQLGGTNEAYPPNDELHQIQTNRSTARTAVHGVSWNGVARRGLTRSQRRTTMVAEQGPPSRAAVTSSCNGHPCPARRS